MRVGMLLHPYGEVSPGGLGRAVFEMAKGLLDADRNNTYTLYFKDSVAARPPFGGTHWAYRVLGSQRLWLTGGRGMDKTLDAYIFFTPVIPLFFRPKKSIVMALDFAYMAYPGRFPGWLAARFLYLLHRRSLRMADRVLAISKQTAGEVTRLFGVPPAHITIIPMSYIPLGDAPRPVAVPEKFFLFAGVLKKRKNVAGVIRAFAEFRAAHPEYGLVIAGKNEGPYYRALVSLSRALGLYEHVRFLGYVTNAELAYVYGKAEALVFPSFIEGFGMPVLEAMHAGLPVITSKSGALAEVADGAALLVDPQRPDDIARAMSRCVEDPALRADLIRRGAERVRHYSWEKTARAILAALEEVTRAGRTLA